MKLVDCILMWINGLLKPESVVKRFEKERPGLVDGIKSVALIGLIAGIVFYATFVLSSPYLEDITGFDPASVNLIMLFLFIVALPVALIIALLVWTILFRMFASNLGGKSKFEDEVGFFGIVAGSLAIAMIPVALFAGMANMVVPNIIAYYVILGIGTLITAALSGIVTGIIYETLSSYEKTSLPRSGLIYGLTQGVITLIMMIITALMMNVVAQGLPYTDWMW